MSDPGKAVFLSYASQDVEAAKRICDALRASGVEIWFDTDGGLEHGDEWDAKIRRQIKECVLFLPIISANTQAREEGYFRIEWDLAAERARGIASGVAFILPVVIDATAEPVALVPDRFRSVQWTRLPGGVMPADVLQRFLKLWSHRAGVVKQQSKEQGVGSKEPGARSTEPFDAAQGRLEAGRPRPATSGPKWLRPILASAAIVIAVLAFTLISRRTPEPGVVPPVVPVPAPAPATMTPLVSPARELVAKVYGLIRGVDATREDFALAEEYCQRALKLDPDDGEVWAAYSQVHAAFGYRGWDTSPERREQTRATAERAIRLAPHSVDARIAQAGAWSIFGINRDEREKLLREVVHDDPDNKPALRFLAVTVLGRPDGFEECLALNERAAALAGGDAIALFNNARYLWNRGRPAESYATLERALAQQTFASGLVLKMAMEINWRGDLAAAEATLRQIPPAALQEDRANYDAGLIRYFQRNPDAALEAWQTFPRNYYVDFIFEGPKGLLLGLAHELAHRDAAARTEWQAALREVEKRITAAPNKAAPYYSQAFLLACLGEKAAAGEALRTHEQLAGIKYPPGQPMPIALAQVYARLGRFDEIFAHLPTALPILRISPDFDTLRADPRFQALVGRESSSAKASEDLSGFQAEPDKKSVAVLAFANLSDDKANEYFSDGISEELLNVLAKVPGLKVTARTSSFHFKGKDTSIPEIARQLGVAYVVEGSVRKSGDKVRITAQLIKAADGFHVWSDTFTRDLKDVFAVQDEIAGLIAKNLELKMDVATKVVVKVDPEAYRLFLEGRQILQRRTLESYAQAEKLFAQAQALAPDWAPVYAGQADVARLRAFGTQGPSGPDSPWLPDMKTAKALADRALELDPSLAEAYVSLSGTAMIAWNFPEGERLIRRALELNPNQADAYLVLGRLKSAEGRMDESLAALRRAVDLNPLAPRILDNLAAELGFTGRYAEAWEIIERANALQPDSSQIQCYRVRLLADMDRREEALTLARRMVENPNPEDREFRLIEAARAFARFGLKAEAAAAAARVPANVPEYVILQAYLGEPRTAVPHLDILSFGWIEDLLWGRGFDPIRHDPGYEAYLARTGLTEANARAQAWRKAHPPEKPATEK